MCINSCKLTLLINRLPWLIFAYICKYCYCQDFEKGELYEEIEKRKYLVSYKSCFKGLISFLSVRLLTLMK